MHSINYGHQEKEFFNSLLVSKEQANDSFRIMAATGHKTMSVFKRYNTVSKEELKALAGGTRN